jgi:hypothetical protein
MFEELQAEELEIGERVIDAEYLAMAGYRHLEDGEIAS